MKNAKQAPRPPVHQWPDAPGAEQERCAGTKQHPGCGTPFSVVAVHGERLCGRNRCPHCKAPRKVPASLEPVAAQWHGLIPHHVRKAVATGLDRDTAEDVVTGQFVKALLCWVPSQGKFSTVASVYIQRAVRLAKHTQHQKARPKANTAVTDATLRHAAAPWLPFDDRDEVASRDERSRVYDVLHVLTPRQLRVVRLRFGLWGCPTHTLAEVAENIGVTKERVRQLEVRALRHLSEALNPNPSTGV